MRDVWKGTQDFTAILAVVLLFVIVIGLLFGVIDLKEAKQLGGWLLLCSVACVFLDGRGR